ncbi:hypothetical protein FPJ27_37160 (plasmid) [Burkholderia sp. MS455]|uniref:hypothetical protein n=1 Tax=Burkholderia sp. MS455 TaxID=2811788 RepID=UPI00195A93E6|nr:hypothetical protein [Burkholderia sp. MS455]QRR11828.1 hypothetical protein FPJ27_37160 [Burkholderia sp. MS455]
MKSFHPFEIYKFNLLAFLVISMAMFSPTHAAPLTDIAPLPATQLCWAVGVNNAGSVVGNCVDTVTGNDEEFIRTLDGTVRVLPALSAGRRCDVVALNDANTVVGMCDDGTGAESPTLWSAAGGTPIKLSPAGLATGASVQAINADAWAIGTESNGGSPRAVLWTPSGRSMAPHELPLPGLLGLGWEGCSGTTLSNATLNHPANLVGTCLQRVSNGDQIKVAVAWSSDPLLGYIATPLPGLGAGPCNIAAVNAAAQATGTCTDSNGIDHAVFWPTLSNTAAIVALGAIDGHSTAGSWAVSLNSNGQVAGQYKVNGEARGFYWNPAQGNTTGQAIGTLGGAVTQVSCINGSGGSPAVVVGKSETSSTGQMHAYSWTPGNSMPIDLGVESGGANSGSSCITDAGYIAGASETTQGNGNLTWHAFITQTK